jgi:hypothetical protein
MHSNRICRSPCRRQLAPACLAAVVALAYCCAGAAGALAQTVDQVLEAMPFSTAERQAVRNGTLVTATLPSSNNRELAVALAFTMNLPPSAAETKFRQAIYRGDTKVIAVGVISDAAPPDDFAKLTLGTQGAAAAQALLNASPGEAVNLSSDELAAFAALRAQSPDPARVQSVVEQQLRVLLRARYQAYRTGGLSAIAPYDRGHGRLVQPGVELRDSTEASAVLSQFAPAAYQLLLNYPQGKPAQLDERFHWVVYDISGNPTVALSHRLWANAPNAAIMVDRLFYVSTGFNTEQAVGGFLPFNAGTMVVYNNRTSTDQVDGFGSSAKRAIGDHMMTSELAESFRRLQSGD